MTRGVSCISLHDEVMSYWIKFLRRGLADEACKAEHLFGFHAVLSEECLPQDLVLTDVIDGDTVFWVRRWKIPYDKREAERDYTWFVRALEERSRRMQRT